MNTPVRLGGTLVGMHFRPPASDVVNMLPSKCPLILQRQPENQYDTNAVQVLLPGFSVDGEHSRLFDQFHADAEGNPELLGRLQDPLFLGYVCNSEKTGGKKADPIAKIMDDAGYFQVKAWLIFNAKGNPEIETDCEEHRDPDLEVEEDEDVCFDCGEPIDECVCDQEDEEPDPDKVREAQAYLDDPATRNS